MREDVPKLSVGRLVLCVCHMLEDSVVTVLDVSLIRR
jgi:hypothetical protein